MEGEKSFILKIQHKNYKDRMICKEYRTSYQWLARRMFLHLIHQNIFSQFHNRTKYRKGVHIRLHLRLKSGTNDLIYIFVLID